jgi:hypothetical protein
MVGWLTGPTTTLLRLAGRWNLTFGYAQQSAQHMTQPSLNLVQGLMDGGPHRMLLLVIRACRLRNHFTSS